MTGTGINIELIQASALFGTVLPAVAAVLMQDRLSLRANSVIMVATAMVAAVMTTGARHELTAAGLINSFITIYVVAIAFHHGLWRPTGVSATIQTRTSVRRTAPARRAGIDLGRC